jgi:hypothetical protein
MHDPHLVEIFLFALGGLIGFLTGYAVRSAISHHHRAIAKRNRAAGYY